MSIMVPVIRLKCVMCDREYNTIDPGVFYLNKKKIKECHECYKKVLDRDIKKEIKSVVSKSKLKPTVMEEKNTLPNQAQIELEKYFDYFLDLYILTVKYSDEEEKHQQHNNNHRSHPYKKNKKNN